MHDAGPTSLGRGLLDVGLVVEVFDEVKSVRVSACYSRHTDTAPVRALKRTLQKLTRNHTFADMFHTRLIEESVVAPIESLAELHERLDVENEA